MDSTLFERSISDEELDLLSQAYFSAARESFWYFRLLMDPSLHDCWWQRHAAQALQTFYAEYIAGKRPKLILNAPPQHGKSRLLNDFCLWMSGKLPDTKLMFASYSEDLGQSANMFIQRAMRSRVYMSAFPETKISDRGQQSWKCTDTLIEFIEHSGSFRNTTVQGPINGFGLDIGIIDDPIKGRAEAQSPTIRKKTWDWLTDDFFLRFSDKAGLVMIQTTWHVDDPTGRWLIKFPDTKVLKYAGIAEGENDWTVKAGFREAGEALFPEHKSLEFILERKSTLTDASFAALYQQRPYIVGGGIFPIEKFRTLSLFDKTQIRASIRAWDKAGSSGTGCYTAGALMHRMFDGTFVIEHIERGQWGALEREQRIKFWTERDASLYRNYQVIVEQEPGSGGKESAESTIRNLAGYIVKADKVGQSKDVRAEPFAAQVQGGNVFLVAGQWHYNFLEEAEIWGPGAAVRDQIDACACAFNHLTLGKVVDTTLAWVS